MSNPRSIPNRDLTQRKLLDLVKSDVQNRWKNTLHNRIYFAANSNQNTSPISLPFSLQTLQTHENPSKELSLIDLLEKPEIQGQLVILGQSGSGKSTILLQLAQILLNKAEEDDRHPIPILLNLSVERKSKQTFKEWLIKNLRLVYGVRSDIAQEWIEKAAIIPLLDGLDRLTLEHQERCVKIINQFLVGESWSNPFIVCDGLIENSSFRSQLSLNYSLILHPLSISQIQTYLIESDNEALWNSLQTNSNLMILAQVPLFLNLIIIASEQITSNQWNIRERVEETRKKIVTIYRQTRISQTPKRVIREKLMKQWLGWLAIQLKRNGFSDFRVEYLQPYWLETREEKLMYGAIFGIIVGSIYAVSLFLVFIRMILNHSSLYQAWAVLSLLVNMGGIIVSMMLGMGLIYGLKEDKISLTEPDSLSLLQQIRKNLRSGLSYGLIFGLILGQPITIMLTIAGLKLIIEFIQTLINNWSQPKLESRVNSNQDFYKKVTQGIYTILIIIIPSLIIFRLLPLENLTLLSIELIKKMTLITVLLGTIVYFSLYPVWQHLTLRCILWLFLHSPINYTKMLNNGVNCSLLQRVRGTYQFSHQLFQESFEEVYQNKKD